MEYRRGWQLGYIYYFLCFKLEKHTKHYYFASLIQFPPHTTILTLCEKSVRNSKWHINAFYEMLKPQSVFISLNQNKVLVLLSWRPSSALWHHLSHFTIFHLASTQLAHEIYQRDAITTGINVKVCKKNNIIKRLHNVLFSCSSQFTKLAYYNEKICVYFCTGAHHLCNTFILSQNRNQLVFLYL